MSKPRISRTRLAVIFSVAGLAAILAGIRLFVLDDSRADADAAAATADQSLPVSVIRVGMQSSYRVSRMFTGRVTPRRRTDLGFELAGELAELAIDTGDRVEKGQRLARLDTAHRRARRRQLGAALAEARADLRLAEKTRSRTERLFKQGHVSEDRLDQAVAEAEAAQARVDSAVAEVALIDVELANSDLLAPYAGTIERRLLDEGAIVDPGEPVARLIEDSVLEAEIGLPLEFSRRLSPGAHLPLKTESGELVFGRVRALVPAIRGDTRTTLVTLSIAGDVTADIADGSLVTLELKDRIEDAGFWIPISALSADVRGLWRVYTVVGADSGAPRVTFENVQILHSEDTRAYVSGTVNDGDLLLSGGVERVVPGDTVRIVSESPAPRADDGSR